MQEDCMIRSVKKRGGKVKFILDKGVICEFIE